MILLPIERHTVGKVVVHLEARSIRSLLRLVSWDLESWLLVSRLLITSLIPCEWSWGKVALFTWIAWRTIVLLRRWEVGLESGLRRLRVRGIICEEILKETILLRWIS